MLKFDTRDKKPKLWNVAILTAVAAVVVFFLVRDPDNISIPVTTGVLAAYFLSVQILLLRAFVHQIQYNPYSYNTIYYFGFAIFLFFVVITMIIVLISALIDPERYGELYAVLSLLVSSAADYVRYTSPVILVFSVCLFISNISLIRHEGKRLNNFLGMLLAVLLVGGFVILFFADYSVSGSQQAVMFHEMGVNLYSAIYLYVECMIAGAIVADMIAAKHEPDLNRDYIIILGCQIRTDGTPTPLLAGRVDRAIAFYKKQIRKTGKAPILIPSGGQGSDEIQSESESMKAYMLEHDVPEEHILMEDRSANTYENMIFSKEKIEAENPDAKVSFSTTNYHVFRSGVMARRIKMRADGMGAKTKWYFWPNAAVREFIGLLSQHRIKQLCVLGGLIAVYVLLTLWKYSL